MTTLNLMKTAVAAKVSTEVARLTTLQAAQRADGDAKIAAAKADKKNIAKAINQFTNEALKARLMAVCQGALDAAIAEAENLKIQSDGDIDAFTTYGAMIQALTPADLGVAGVASADDVIDDSVARGLLAQQAMSKRTKSVDSLTARAQALGAAYGRVVDVNWLS